MPEATIKRWSRRIVHPRLTLETSDTDAAARAIREALEAKRFKAMDADGDGVRLRQRPWFAWLASAAATSCIIRVRVVGAAVEVDAEQRGDFPAPERVAAALTEAVRRLHELGVEVAWQGWEAVA